jgi:hypothetical protein
VLVSLKVGGGINRLFKWPASAPRGRLRYADQLRLPRWRNRQP